LLDIDYYPRQIYYLRDVSRDLSTLTPSYVALRPGNKLAGVYIGNQRFELSKDSCVQLLSRYDGNIHYSSIAWDDLRAFDDLNGGWASEIRQVVSRAVTDLEYRQADMEYVAKPGELRTTSVMKLYWSGDKISSTIIYAAHPREQLLALAREVEKSQLILRMIDVSSSFSIRYPIGYFKSEQLESWAEFEQRLERSKRGGN